MVVVFIIGALLVALGSLAVLISSDFERVAPSDTSIGIFWASLGSFPPAALLYVFIGLTWKGQTVGKSVMNIMVIRSDGRPLGVLGAIGRVIGLLIYPLFLGFGGLTAWALKDNTWQSAVSISIAVVLVIAGLMWAAFDTHRRTLHDRIAGTIVVRVG